MRVVKTRECVIVIALNYNMSRIVAKRSFGINGVFRNLF